MSEDIQIYVADLAAYNNGILHGVWIDATQDIDDIWDAVRDMLIATPLDEKSEEYAIHDYEGFGSYRLGEYHGLESVHEIACFIEEHGAIATDLINHLCGDVEEARKAIEENYAGCYNSLTDYARELTKQQGDIPKHLEFYIDYDKMGRDMDMSGDIFIIETAHDEVHIFWSH